MPTYEDFRRTYISDEEIARIPEIRREAAAEDAALSERQGFEYSSGEPRQILGAPNVSRMRLERYEALVRLARKHYDRRFGGQQ